MTKTIVVQADASEVGFLVAVDARDMGAPQRAAVYDGLRARDCSLGSCMEFGGVMMVLPFDSDTADGALSAVATQVLFLLEKTMRLSTRCRDADDALALEIEVL